MTTAPLVRKFQIEVPASAAGVTTLLVMAESPFAGSVTRLAYVPIALITGVNVNTRRFSAQNKGQAGAGVVELGFKQMDLGTNAPAFDALELTLAAAGSLVVAQGDVIEAISAAVGAGLADPGGEFLVEITRT